MSKRSKSKLSLQALAEMNMEENKFLLFKKEFLREFGNSGFVRDMERELTKNGKARSGTASAESEGQKYIAGKKGATAVVCQQQTLMVRAANSCFEVKAEVFRDC